MSVIELLAINKDEIYSEDLADLVERSFDFFNYDLWGGVEFLGSVNIKYDTKICIKGLTFPAHNCMNLMERLEKLKKSFNIKRPLVAASYDPLVRIYSAFEKGALMTFADVVRDYVHDDVVMFSLFGISPEKSIKTMIHTLGHLGGLRHHEKPIDIMYIDPISEIDMDEYFCKRCDEHLKEKSLENL